MVITECILIQLLNGDNRMYSHSATEWWQQNILSLSYWIVTTECTIIQLLNGDNRMYYHSDTEWLQQNCLILLHSAERNHFCWVTLPVSEDLWHVGWTILALSVVFNLTYLHVSWTILALSVVFNLTYLHVGWTILALSVVFNLTYFIRQAIRILYVEHC